MSGHPRHSVSVSGIVQRNDGKLLLVRRRDTGAWVTPGGILELSEAPIEGVAREVFEESGIRVEVERLTGVYKNTSSGVLSLAFLCHPRDDAPTPWSTPEATDIEWTTVETALSRLNESFGLRVTDALPESRH